MKYLMTFKKEINVILLVLVGLLLTCLLYIGLISHPTSDANYYIPIAWDVFDGYTPTYNVQTDYMPFVYYILAFFFWLFGNTSHNIAVVVLFLFSTGNCILLYYLLKNRISLSKTVSLVFICIYAFSLFKLTAFQMFLEPFQVFFALFSFICISSSKTSHFKVLSSGILMGMSIMCKQYSALFAIGFALWMLLRLYKKDISIKILFRDGIVWTLGVLLPYFIFIWGTKATLAGSLQSFGFIGDNATSYAAIKPSIFKIGIVEIIKVLALHSLEFIAFIVYPIFRRKFKDEKNIIVTDGIFIIGLFAFVSIYIRQYTHYFQLIFPWAIMLWAFMLDSVFKKAKLKESNFNRFLIIAGFVVSLPIILYMSPKQIYYNYKTNVIDKKSYQIDFTNEALQVFKSGSAVHVRGNCILYVSCNYRNPVHSYSFLSPAEMIKNGSVPKEIDSIIIPKLPSNLFENHKQFFLDNGFKIIADKAHGLYLIK